MLRTSDGHVIDERFARTARMLGAEGMERLRRAHVAVVGLGAVGSYVVEALARAGVGRLRLVDFDTIQPSNINRQLFALESTVGRPKHEVARRRVLAIHPACQVEALDLFVRADTVEQVLAGPPDLVIDAIDALLPKIELLAATVRRGIPVIASMGAALRTDPTAIRVAPLDQTHHCPLARRVRNKLRRLYGIDGDFPCVFSTEPRSEMPPDAMAEYADSEPLAQGRGRPRRTLGSLPTIPGIFGLTAAHVAVQWLAEGAGRPSPGSRGITPGARPGCPRCERG